MCLDDKIRYYRSCSVCRKVEFEGRLVSEDELKELTKGRIYRLTHTYLSKSCFRKYLKELMHLPAYQGLREKCD